MDKYLALVLFCSIAIFVKRGTALAVLVASMVIWPEFIRFDILVTKMSIPRFVAIIILVKWWSKSKLTVNRYDKAIILLWFLGIVMPIFEGAKSSWVFTTIVRGMDTVLMYFAARVCLININECNRFLSGLKLPIFFALILGVYESTHSTSPFVDDRLANPWMWYDFGYRERLGTLVRAFGTTLQPIFWGMTLTLVFMIYFALSRIEIKKGSAFMLIIIFFAAFTSISSGPLGAILMTIGLTYLITSKSRMKLLLMFALASAIFIELFSNRHFYYIAQYLTLDGATAWYRGKLIDVALEYINTYIWFGVGGNWPNYWGALIDGRDQPDIVNQFIWVMLGGGISALIVYLYILISPIRNFYKSWPSIENTLDSSNRILIISIISIIVSGFSVAFFNPYELLIYILLGVTRQVEIFRSEHVLSGKEA